MNPFKTPIAARRPIVKHNNYNWHRLLYLYDRYKLGTQQGLRSDFHAHRMPEVQAVALAITRMVESNRLQQFALAIMARREARPGPNEFDTII